MGIIRQTIIGGVLLFSAIGHAADGVINVHLAGERVTLDWTKSTHQVDLPLLSNLQEGLAYLATNLKPVPMLAESWEFDSTGTKIKFYIRRGVHWSDGRILSSNDFLAAFKRVLDPTLKISRAYLLYDVKGARDYHSGKQTDFSKVGFKTPSPGVLEVELVRPHWNWIENTANPSLFPVREDLIQKKGTAWTLPGNMVTNGPFRLSSHTHDKEFQLIPNEHYPHRRLRVKLLNFQILSFEEALSKAKQGQIDVMFNVPYKFEKEAQALKGFKVIRNPLSRVRKLDFNLSRYPMGVTEIRQSLAASIDRKSLVQNFDERWSPGSSYALPWMFPYSATAGVKFDTIASRRLLAGAGFGPSVQLKLDVLVPNFDENRGEQVEIAQELKKRWEKILGIQVNLIIADSSSQYLLLRDGGAYHVVLRDSNVETADALSLYESYATDSRFGIKWDSPEYDELLLKAKTVKDNRERNKVLRQIDEILVTRKTITVPLFYKGDLTIVRNNIEGIPGNSWRPYSLKDIDLKKTIVKKD